MDKIIGIISRTRREKVMGGLDMPFALEDCVKMIKKSNLIPVILPRMSQWEDKKALLKKLDGLFIWSQDSLSPFIYGEDPKRDDMEFSLEDDKEALTWLDLFIKNKKKVLVTGSCIQLLNVYFGGIVDQDPIVDENSVIHKKKDSLAYHYIEVEEGSYLSKFFEKNEIVNSDHGEKIFFLAKDLRASARALDGTIEAVEGRDGNQVLGFQFYLEKMRGKKISDLLSDFFEEDI